MAVSQSLSVTEVAGSANVADNSSKVRILWTSTQTGQSWNGYTRTAYYWVSINGGAETKYSVSYTLPQYSTKTILDTTITPELIKEGYMREFVSKVQQMRKDSDFNVVDHIAVTVECDEELTVALKDYEDRIKSDVLADSIAFASDENAKEWDVNGKTVKIAVKKI